MADALLPLAVVVTALACTYIAAHTALEWVVGRYSNTAIRRPPMCACDSVVLDEGLISLTFSGTTHTRSVCHPEAS